MTQAQALTVDVRTRRVDHAQCYVDGEWVPAAAGVTFPTVDPSTGRTIAAVPRADSSDVDRAVAAAKRVAVEWQFTDAIGRAALLRTLAGLVTEHAEELAQLEALDSGHYLAKARELVGAIPLWLEYWAGLADKVGGRTIAVPGNKLSFTLVAQCNDSPFGLYAVLWSQDITSALSTARRLQVGSVMINDWFGELPMAPHGGHKQSGTGREEGLEAIHGYTQVKHVSVNLDGSLRAATDWAGAPL